jgi:acetylornithine deacetylase
MLCAHLDTVGVAGMHDPFSPRIEGTRMYGRGSYDMKGGLAAAMIAGANAAERGFAGDVVVAAVADEECASVGIQSVLESWKADACVLSEPTGLDVCIAHRGFVWFELRVHGRAAHGSQPSLGVDSIAAAGHALVGITELEEQLKKRTHSLLGRGSVHASMIQGGQELSSYPELCVVGVERRTLPGASVEDEIEALVDRIPGDVAVDAEVLLVRPPFEINADAEIVALVSRVAASARDAEPAIVGHPAWMDAAFLSEAGIPTVVFGPRGAGAHALEEWVEIGDVALVADVLTTVAGEFCR